MKSKAHMKKCLELGVSMTMDETDIQEPGRIPIPYLMLANNRIKSNLTVFYSG